MTEKLKPYAERKPENVVLSTRVTPFEGGFEVKWSVRNVGFGEFVFGIGEDGTVKIHNECMGPEFIKHVMNHVIDNAELVDG